MHARPAHANPAKAIVTKSLLQEKARFVLCGVKAARRPGPWFGKADKRNGRERYKINRHVYMITHIRIPFHFTPRPPPTLPYPTLSPPLYCILVPCLLVYRHGDDDDDGGNVLISRGWAFQVRMRYTRDRTTRTSFEGWWSTRAPPIKGTTSATSENRTSTRADPVRTPTPTTATTAAAAIERRRRHQPARAA